jgi:ribosome-binding protein aMBF1 (putative translation factor)
MDQDNGYTLDDLYAKLNQDVNFQKADRKIRPYFDVVEQIIRRRNERGLTQKDLAEILGTHQSRISKIESAELDVRLSTLIDIAEALETELIITLLPIEEPQNYIPVGQARLETQNVPNIVVTGVNVVDWGARP